MKVLRIIDASRQRLIKNEQHTFFQVGVQLHHDQQTTVAKEEMERPTAFKTEQAWVGLYPIADDDDDDICAVGYQRNNFVAES